MLKLYLDNRYLGCMKPARKRVSFLDMFREAETELRAVFIERPQEWVKTARERLRDLPKSNFDLGCEFAEMGKWFDAIFRFRMALYLQPNYPQAWYNLGCCYFRTGKHDKAREALLKALNQEPTNTNAIFMLATIDPAALPQGMRPTQMPESMVTGFFGAMAQGYDIAEATSQYQAGKVIYDLLRPLVPTPNPVVVDLGCGTGIVSRPWRATAKEIIGVDVTPAMIALAAKASHVDKKLFDALVPANITALPESLHTAQADLVLLVNVAQFVGDLSSTLQNAARLLGPQGVLVLTVEPYQATTGFGLSSATGRFGHSAAYVQQQAAASGLKLVKESSVALYVGSTIQAFVFSKGTN